jgi:putative ABC transport system permease protein
MEGKLLNFVLKSKRNHFTDERIEEILRFYKWSDQDIQNALAESERIYSKERKKMAGWENAKKGASSVLWTPFKILGKILSLVEKFFSMMLGGIFIQIPKFIIQMVLAVLFLIVLICADIMEFIYKAVRAIIMLPLNLVKKTPGKFKTAAMNYVEKVELKEDFIKKIEKLGEPELTRIYGQKEVARGIPVQAIKTAEPIKIISPSAEQKALEATKGLQQLPQETQAMQLPGAKDLLELTSGIQKQILEIRAPEGPLELASAKEILGIPPSKEPVGELAEVVKKAPAPQIKEPSGLLRILGIRKAEKIEPAARSAQLTQAEVSAQLSSGRDALKIGAEQEAVKIETTPESLKVSTTKKPMEVGAAGEALRIAGNEKELPELAAAGTAFELSSSAKAEELSAGPKEALMLPSPSKIVEKIMTPKLRTYVAKAKIKGFSRTSLAIRFWMLIAVEILKDIFARAGRAIVRLPANTVIFIKKLPRNSVKAFSWFFGLIGAGLHAMRVYLASILLKAHAAFLILTFSFQKLSPVMAGAGGRTADIREFTAQKIKIKTLIEERKKPSFLGSFFHFVGRLFVLKERMRFSDVLRLSLRMFKTRRMRTLLTILGISVGSGTILFLVSFGYGLQNIIFEKIATNEALLSLDVSPGGELLPINDESLNKIKNIAQVEKVSPVGTIPAQIKMGNLNSNTVINAIDVSYFSLAVIEPVAGQLFTEADTGSVVVSSAVAKLLNIQNVADLVGKDVSFALFSTKISDTGTEETTVMDLPSTFKVAGVIDDDNSNYAYMNLSAVDGYEIKNYSLLKVKVAKDVDLDPVRTQIADMGFVVSALSDTIAQAKTIFNGVQIVLSLFGIVALFVSAIGMFNTMTITLLERTNEIGIMKSIGASNGDIWFLFVVESLSMGFMGGLTGVMIGVLGGQTFNYILNLLAKGLGGKSLSLFYSPWWFIATILAFSSVVGLFTGLWPARRASTLDTLKALKYK